MLASFHHTRSQKQTSNISDYYSQNRWLDPEDSHCNPDQYFKEISYFIDLTEIYDYVDTCYFNDDMTYCPVLVKLSQESIIKSFDGCNYVLQVWNKDTQRKTYEKAMKSKIKKWNILYQYLAFILEDEPGIINIVDLKNGNKLMKIQNFANDLDVKHISLSGQYLYVASDHEVQILHLETICSKDGEVLNVADGNAKVRIIKTRLRILALVFNGLANSQKFQPIAFESDDNQIEYAKLVLKEFTDDNKFEYSYEILRERMPRTVKNDPIVKFKYVYANGYMFGSALRQSGDCDLYWNFMHKNEVEGKFINDIDMSFGSFYFKTRNGQVFQLDHQNSAMINFEQAYELFQRDFDFKKLYIKMIQTIVKPFVGFNILRTNNTGTIVVLAHARFISVYNILEQRWVHHCQYEDEILYLFRHYEDKDNRYQCVILKNGAVYIGVINNSNLVDNVPAKAQSVKFKGQIVRICQDLENNQTLYVLIKDGDKYRLDALVRGKVQNIDVLANVTENLGIVLFQSRGENTKVLFQNGKSLALYSQVIKDNQVSLSLLHNFSSIADNFKNILHSGCSYDIAKHMFLFDKEKMYVVLIKDKNHVVRTYNDIFCCGIQTISNTFNYALCQETPTSSCPGLRYFDMELIIQKDRPILTLLKKIDVGTLGYFEQGVTIERLGFLNSINSLIVSPILHRNVIRYMGMKPAADYKIFNEVNGKFLGLLDQQIQTYCQFTGKFESSYDIPKHIIDMSKLTYADRKKYGRVLFVTTENVKVENENDFYFDWQMQPSMDKLVTFQQAAQKTYKKYYYLEIAGSREIKIHAEFVHPHYGYQRVFFNKNVDKMITILLNYRTFVYRKVSTDLTDETKFKWELIRCMKSYPNDLDNEPKFLEFFSPCFSRYLTINQKTAQFVVTNVDDGSEIVQIPQEILKPDTKTENIKHATNRIQWLDLSTIRIVNNEGVEMIFNIDKNFKRLAYNKIPLFNEISGEEFKTHHIYKERPSLNADQLLERLTRRYQSYKSRYLMSENPTMDDLLYELFHRDVVNAQYAEASLTYVHWSLINQLKNDVISFDDLSTSVIETLLYNILPGGNTMLHMISDKKEQLQQVLDLCHKDDKIVIHMPFLANLEGETPIHQLLQKRNVKSINTFLKILSYYDIDHHSRWINNLYSSFVEHEMPEFLNYMDSRFQQTKQIQSIDRGPLKEDHPDTFVTQLWYKNDTIDHTLYDLTEGAHVQNFKIEYLDMPGAYHCLSGNFKEFFSQLSETQNYSYFENKAIQTIIDFNYHLVKKRIIQLIVYPFIAFHILFVFYTNVIYINKNDDNYKVAHYTFSLLLLAFALYFFVYELTQIMIQGITYIYSFWNYIDLLAPIGVILLYILQFVETAALSDHQQEDKYREIKDYYNVLNSTILSLSTFFMWLKILYILRIFKETGYLIRAIVEVIYDMRIFLLILFLTAITFGDSFLKLSQGNYRSEDDIKNKVNEGHNEFIPNFGLAVMYGYRMILGDFATDDFGDVAVPLAWFFFFLCTILDMIVMLNLLIAIISDTYARVASNADQAAYQEMAKLIDENMYLVPRQEKESYAPQNQYILVVENLEKIEYSNADPVVQKIEQALTRVQTELTQETNKINSNTKSLSKTLLDISEKIEAIQKEQKELKQSQDNFAKREIQAKAIKNSDYTASKIHNHMLLQMSIQELKEVTNITSFRCDGRNYDGCKSDKPVISDDPESELYHCYTCGMDYCSKCNSAYGHTHVMRQVKFNQISDQQKYKDNNNSWRCSGADFEKCKNHDKHFTEIDDITFCCRECDFDLCSDCIKKHRA